MKKKNKNFCFIYDKYSKSKKPKISYNFKKIAVSVKMKITKYLRRRID